MAVAPSLTPGALPAVIVASSEKTGLSRARPSRVVSGRGCSSAATVVVPLGVATAMGTSSSVKEPALRAVAYRCWLLYAYSSCRSRETSNSFATLLPSTAMWQPLAGSIRPSRTHAVDQGAVAKAIPEARLLEQVGRLAHAFHPTRNDRPGITAADQERGQVHGLERRRAYLVDGERRHTGGNASLDGGLPGRDLAHAGRD